MLCSCCCGCPVSGSLFSSCRLFELSCPEDYRRLALTASATRLLQQPLLPGGSSSSVNLDRLRRYFWPLNSAAEAALHDKWSATISSAPSSNSSGGHMQHQPHLSSGSSTSAAALMHYSSGSSTPSTAAAVVPVMFGRQLPVSRSSSGAAWFDFTELCGRPLGAADYLAVAQNFHTVFISGEHNA